MVRVVEFVTLPCVAVMSELPVGTVGQVLRLKCELYPAQSVECTVQVRHVNADCLGARVIEISDAGKVLCQRYLEEHRTPAAEAVARR